MRPGAKATHIAVTKIRRKGIRLSENTWSMHGSKYLLQGVRYE